MASKKPADSNSVAMSNVKVKVEPGTSTAPLLKNIKVEPGLPGATTRLTSFRIPRDLTLGANIKSEKPKKVYTPNVNVQRNKKKDDGASVKKEIKPGRGRGRGRGQGERGRGRGKTPSNLIQSTGIFSEGITDLARGSRRSGGGYRESSSNSESRASFMEKPLLKFNQTIDKADEEEKLKSLLRDDFIDDGSEPFIENPPISLPLVDEGKLYKSESNSGVEMQTVPGEEEVDVKPIILSNGEAVMPSKLIKGNAKVQVDQKARNSVAQIIENQASSYILIQFPNCLPGLRTNDEPTDPRSRRQVEQSSPAVTETGGKSEFCTLGSLKGGLLGKIQICKSGKTRFLVGDNAMVVDVGSRPSFRQDLMAAKIDADNTNSELINLGRVTNTFICSPDWETMLASL
ncbi:DNA-directed RNA polymerase III subunit RPC4 [Venturia canescens]|uniref:DNA-directed RNA polymerase III subunit RPC4 n=1 Tax=Venturia canescens TaxID=32260 RepID=UPI001C9CE830|nr:DNA-directed RNA polymerase III subunit RPC4 [Venturia canescens]XP_043272076.1 DNA-directed RNA polymerase III subunit RPC4 [Venturia canescens]XP_043272077.1 DNA-directed RNA polymerase III subunit RPC4 [Venturia canescens]